MSVAETIRGKTRIQSVDLLRGIVMILMPLDHVRDFFAKSAFIFDPTDLQQTTPVLFFTRWITHFCAPIFVFLAGVSAYLMGTRKTPSQLSSFLFTRGAWLIFAEIVIITLGASFNPTYPFLKLQVIWATGVAMIALSLISRLRREWILGIAITLIATHNLFDQVHVSGQGAGAFIWSVFHDPRYFHYGQTTVIVMYPLLPWIGVMALGYWFGRYFAPDIDPDQRYEILMKTGIFAIVCFVVLRAGNWYGDASQWVVQKNILYSIMSFLNVTKYPPSLLYVLMTIGPALVFLAWSEKSWANRGEVIKVFGRVPMFYYVVHLYLIHLAAFFGAMALGYSWRVMVLSHRINETPELKGYGFNLFTVYLIWIALLVVLYPLCKWFDKYKRGHLKAQPWLSYF